MIFYRLKYGKLVNHNKKISQTSASNPRLLGLAGRSRSNSVCSDKEFTPAATGGRRRASRTKSQIEKQITSISSPLPAVINDDNRYLVVKFIGGMNCEHLVGQVRPVPISNIVSLNTELMKV